MERALDITRDDILRHGRARVLPENLFLCVIKSFFLVFLYILLFPSTFLSSTTGFFLVSPNKDVAMF